MFRSIVGHFFKPARTTLDNFVFRLHYRVTVWLLLACAVALLWKINFGKPIVCVSSADRGDFLDNHCWYDGLFTDINVTGIKATFELVGPGVYKNHPIKSKEFHNVHRWIVIAVLVQAVLFYLPRILWKTLEGRLVEGLLLLNKNRASSKENLSSLRRETIHLYLRKGSCTNLKYVLGHILCELLNLVHVSAQLILVSYILRVTIVSADMLFLSRSQRSDHFTLSAFPVRTKCNFQRIAASGALQRHDALCLTSINGVAESVFIYQWLWFALLTVLSALALLYRVMTVAIPPVRALRLESKTKIVDQGTVRNVVRSLGVGDWFVLYLLSKNADLALMKSLLESLSEGSHWKENS